MKILEIRIAMKNDRDAEKLAETLNDPENNGHDTFMSLALLLKMGQAQIRDEVKAY